MSWDVLVYLIGAVLSTGAFVGQTRKGIACLENRLTTVETWLQSIDSRLRLKNEGDTIERAKKP